MIQDVTHQELRRELIAQRARKVIRQNITTVQEIACLLGEHVSETEILLNAIAEDYAPDAPLSDLLEGDEDEVEGVHL